MELCYCLRNDGHAMLETSRTRRPHPRACRMRPQLRCSRSTTPPSAWLRAACRRSYVLPSRPPTTRRLSACADGCRAGIAAANAAGQAAFRPVIEAAVTRLSVSLSDRLVAASRMSCLRPLTSPPPRCIAGDRCCRPRCARGAVRLPLGRGAHQRADCRRAVYRCCDAAVSRCESLAALTRLRSRSCARRRHTVRPCRTSMPLQGVALLASLVAMGYQDALARDLAMAIVARCARMLCCPRAALSMLRHPHQALLRWP